MSEVSLGKCSTCGDQLLTITHGANRRTICPSCVVLEWERMTRALTETADGLNLWNQFQLANPER